MSSPLLWGPNNTSNNLQNNIALATGQVINSNGLKNYVPGQFETGLHGWALGSVTMSGTTPTGTISAGASSLAVSLQTTGALSGSQSMQVAAATSWSAGEGVYIAFSIDPGAATTMQTISLMYNATAGSPVFGGSSSDTLAIWVYDVTNSAWISPTPSAAGFTQLTKGQVQIQFQATTSTSYQIMILAQNALGSAATMLFDNIFVGQSAIPGYGLVGTDSASYTPTFVNGGVVTGISVQQSRIGEKLFVFGKFTLGSTTGAITMSLPNSAVVDPNKVVTSNYETIGMGSITTAGGYVLTVLAQGGLSTVTFGLQGVVPSSGNVPYAGFGSETFQFSFQVPIQGWSSQSQVISQYDGRVVAMSYAATASTGWNGNMSFSQKLIDTHGAYDGTTFTAPVSGNYSVTFSIPVYLLVNATAYLDVYKNGSIYERAIQISNTQGSTLLTNASATVLVDLKAEETITVVSTSITNAAGSAANGSNYGLLSINLLSGAQQILAGQNIEMRVGGDAPASPTGTAIIFPTVDFDTTSGYNAATGEWTAPVTATYITGGMVLYSDGTGGEVISIYKDNVFDSVVSVINSNGGGALSGLFRANSGQKIKLVNDSGVTRNSGPSSKWFIKQVN